MLLINWLLSVLVRGGRAVANEKISQSIVFKRLSWTVLFLFVYVLGSHLVLPL